MCLVRRDPPICCCQMQLTKLQLLRSRRLVRPMNTRPTSLNRVRRVSGTVFPGTSIGGSFFLFVSGSLYELSGYYHFTIEVKLSAY